MLRKVIRTFGLFMHVLGLATIALALVLAGAVVLLTQRASAVRVVHHRDGDRFVELILLKRGAVEINWGVKRRPLGADAQMRIQRIVGRKDLGFSVLRMRSSGTTGMVPDGRPSLEGVTSNVHWGTIVFAGTCLVSCSLLPPSGPVVARRYRTMFAATKRAMRQLGAVFVTRRRKQRGFEVVPTGEPAQHGFRR